MTSPTYTSSLWKWLQSIFVEEERVEKNIKYYPDREMNHTLDVNAAREKSTALTFPRYVKKLCVL